MAKLVKIGPTVWIDPTRVIGVGHETRGDRQCNVVVLEGGHALEFIAPVDQLVARLANAGYVEVGDNV